MADKVIVVKTCPFCHKERFVTFPADGWEKYHPKEDPTYCMSFEEWASRLDFSDRSRLMNFLWNDEGWHATCLREEDAPWNDPNQECPPEPPQPMCCDDDDLPF